MNESNSDSESDDLLGPDFPPPRKSPRLDRLSQHTANDENITFSTEEAIKNAVVYVNPEAEEGPRENEREEEEITNAIVEDDGTNKEKGKTDTKESKTLAEEQKDWEDSDLIGTDDSELFHIPEKTAENVKKDNSQRRNSQSYPFNSEYETMVFREEEEGENVEKEETVVQVKADENKEITEDTVKRKKEEDEYEVQEPISFRLGGGKPLPPPSKESLERARLLFGFDANPTSNSFAKPSNPRTSIDDKAEGSWSMNKKEYHGKESATEDEKNEEGHASNGDSFFGAAQGPVGFMMGNKKPIPPPSKESLKKARALLGLNDKDGDSERPQDDYDEDKQAPLGDSFRLPHAENEKKGECNGFQGFMLANKKSLPPVSKEAQERARKLFGNDWNDDKEEEAKEEKEKYDGFQGFMLANKKSLPPVSKEAQERARKLFGNDWNDDKEEPKKEEEKYDGFQGFVLANKKSLPPVSKEAQERARKLFGNDWNDDKEEPKKEEEKLNDKKVQPPKIKPLLKPAVPPKPAGKSLVTKSAPASLGSKRKPLLLKMKIPAPKLDGKEGSSEDDATKNGVDLLNELAMLDASQAMNASPKPASKFLNSIRTGSTPLKSLLKTRRASVSYPPSVAHTSPSGIKNELFRSKTNKDVIQDSFLFNPSYKRQELKALLSAYETGKNPSDEIHGLTQYKNNFTKMSIAELFSCDVNADTMRLNSLTAKDYRFRIVDFDTLDDKWKEIANEGSIGWEELETLVRDICCPHSPHLLKKGWVANHYRWIVWKLAGLERSFPRLCGGSRLTPDNVLDQLCARFHKEVDNAKRSALKKIYEKDDVSSKLMVLCVASVIQEGEDSDNTAVDAGDIPKGEESKTAEFKGGIIEMTDGWYSVECRLDPHLSRYLREGKIYSGQKLRVFGAIRSETDGVSPLEPGASSVYLALTVNGTRRAKWFEKLGFQQRRTFPLGFKSIVNDGGLVPSIDVVIVRKFTMLYVESQGENKIVRNEQEECEAMEQYQNKLMQEYQKRVEEGDEDAKEELEKAPPREVFQLLRVLVRECPKFLVHDPDGVSELDLKYAVLTIRSPGDFAQSVPDGTWMRLFRVSVNPFPPHGPIKDMPNMLPFQFTFDGSSARYVISSPVIPVGPSMVPVPMLTCDQLVTASPGTLFDYCGMLIGQCIFEHSDNMQPGTTTGWYYLIDMSGQCLALELTVRHPPKISNNKVICFESLVYERYDDEKGFVIAEAGDISLINATRQQHKIAIQQFEAWSKQALFIIRRQMLRVSELVYNLTHP